MAGGSDLIGLAAECRYISERGAAVGFRSRRGRRSSGGRVIRRWKSSGRRRIGIEGLRGACDLARRNRAPAAVHIDDEAGRILQEEGGVVADAVDVEHDAGGVGGGLRGADAGEEAVVGDFDGAAGELGREVGSVEVEEDAIGIGDTRCLIADFLLEVDGDAGVVGRGPVADAGDERQPAAARRRRGVHHPHIFVGYRC
jgi:hypothetical protein